MEATKATKGADGRKGGERKKSVSKSVKAGLQFPVSHITRFLERGRYVQYTNTSAPIYLTTEVSLNIHQVLALLPGIAP
ncbi:hypothetical protein DVH24_030535 [Malus domestica]|uniref:Histone H2A n=1 Tax=Malus domestica TaxID=3750 RepID=A0A498K286_MALDO|nr:hypothetical protein DVH24_030535 [Malus domestica]